MKSLDEIETPELSGSIPKSVQKETSKPRDEDILSRECQTRTEEVVDSDNIDPCDWIGYSREPKWSLVAMADDKRTASESHSIMLRQGACPWFGTIVLLVLGERYPCGHMASKRRGTTERNELPSIVLF